MFKNMRCVHSHVLLLLIGDGYTTRQHETWKNEKKKWYKKEKNLAVVFPFNYCGLKGRQVRT